MCHLNQFPLKGKASTNSLQHIELLENPFLGDLIQSMKYMSAKSLEAITQPHIILLWINLHMFFVAQDLQNHKICFMPQPPISLRPFTFIHLTMGIPPEYFLLVQKKWKQTLWILVGIPFGIWAIDAQYTKMLQRTDLINTIHPPRERHRWAHKEILEFS